MFPLTTKILCLTFCIMLFPSAALAASSTSVSDYEAILQQLAITGAQPFPVFAQAIDSLLN